MGAKRKKGSKVHVAVDTLGYLLTLHVTPASEGDREQVQKLAQFHHTLLSSFNIEDMYKRIR
jgi:IS5 family transposase